MKVVLVTGCSTGIGLATATLFSEGDYQVIATARNPESSEELVELGKKDNVLLKTLDVCDQVSVDKLFDELNEFGFENPLKAFHSQNNWSGIINSILTTSDSDQPSFIVTTYNTFSSDLFRTPSVVSPPIPLFLIIKLFNLVLQSLPSAVILLPKKLSHHYLKVGN